MALITVGAYAQGTVNFANVGGGAAGSVNAPVTLQGSATRLDGPSWVAQLYYGPAATAETALNAVPGSAPAPFNSGAQAGYFTGGQRAIAGVAGGTTVTLQVRAWNTAAGATYEAANANTADRKSVV